MNRRTLLKLLLASAIAESVDVEQLLWTPNKTIFIPSQAQINYIEGIPYHQSNATIGTWLGIERTTEPWQWNKIPNQGSAITLERIKSFGKYYANDGASH